MAAVIMEGASKFDPGLAKTAVWSHPADTCPLLDGEEMEFSEMSSWREPLQGNLLRHPQGPHSQDVTIEAMPCTEGGG